MESLANRTQSRNPLSRPLTSDKKAEGRARPPPAHQAPTFTYLRRSTGPSTRFQRHRRQLGGRQRIPVITLHLAKPGAFHPVPTGLYDLFLGPPDPVPEQVPQPWMDEYDNFPVQYGAFVCESARSKRRCRTDSTAPGQPPNPWLPPTSSARRSSGATSSSTARPHQDESCFPRCSIQTSADHFPRSPAPRRPPRRTTTRVTRRRNVELLIALAHARFGA
jgi:hypothetical protein